MLLGTALPEDYEREPERQFFTQIHYVALVCHEDELERRLRARPAWRGYDDAKVERMLTLNRWILENAQATVPPMTILDTTTAPIDETLRALTAWVRSVLAHPHGE